MVIAMTHSNGSSDVTRRHGGEAVDSPVRRVRFWLAAAVFVATACSSGVPGAPATAAPAAVSVSPERGALVVVGGGRIDSTIMKKFIELAGGPSAPIVVIPTAGGDSLYDQGCRCIRQLVDAGALDVTVVHTYDPKEADTDAFVAPIRRARGVWFPGGRQWRLVDAYAGTRTELALVEVLERGGVIGGTSAGASILASYLMRGAPEGNRILMSPGHEAGFGYLRNIAVDQHVSARGRQLDLQEVLAAHPALLGIGLDESTAIVVQRDTFTVMGPGMVFLHGGRDTPDAGKPYRTLHAGDRYDLRARRSITTDR
jgi:cyanophycinase